MSITIVSAQQLLVLQNDHPDLKLIDVRLEDDFAARRIPGALNNCVFEVSFAERLDPADLDRPICVYGFGESSHESRMAAEKLVRAGRQRVYEFRGGLEAWEAAGQPVDTGEQPSSSSATPDSVVQIDLSESKLEWLGRNLLNKHWGRLGLKSGQLEFANGQLTGGSFTIDMAAMTCDDLAGDPLHDVLIGHIASDDFFDVARFPEARFEITEVQPVPGAAPGEPNLEIAGALTLKGVTAPVRFTAIAGFADDKPAAQAAFAFDRTKWNVLYGSGKFFQRVAGHLVNDLIELQLRIVAK